MSMGLVKLGIIGVLLLAAFFGGMYIDELAQFLGAGVTGAAVQALSDKENATQLYAWTTALCGTDSRCIDVLVSCNGTQILNVTPISGLVAHDDFWEDPRGEITKELCPR